MLHTVLGHCDLYRWTQNLNTSYPQHISHIFLRQQSQFFVRMHQDIGGCSVLLWATVTVTSGLSCIKNRVLSISSKL